MGTQYAENRAKLYLSLIESEPLARAVAAALNEPDGAQAIKRRVKATGVHQTSLIELEASGPTAEAAVAVARGYALVLPEFAKSVEDQSGLRQGPALTLLGPPDGITAKRKGLPPWQLVSATTLSGGLIGLALCGWYRRRNPVVTGPRAARRLLGIRYIQAAASNDLRRLAALLHRRSRKDGALLLVSATRADQCHEFVEKLAAELRNEHLPVSVLRLVDIGAEPFAPNSNGMTLIEASELLDDSVGAAALRGHDFETVIVTRRNFTRIQSVVELNRLLELNGRAADGVFIVRSPRPGRMKQSGSDVATSSVPANPWPIIDVLEEEKASTTQRSAAGAGQAQESTEYGPRYLSERVGGKHDA